MGPDLLERQKELRTLASLVERAVSGRGSTALVVGDAGIGKTSLVRELLASLPRDVRVLAAGCEDLLTPRTLGPLRDAVRGREGPLAEALTSGADQDDVFAAVLAELGSGAPTLLVVDDAHWADGATFDVLRFLGRRIADLPAMLLLTYRDDEAEDGHPLRNLLGGMTGAETVRLRLAPLTVDGVTALAAGAEVDAADLFRLTQGNPFFVTEVLATAPDVLVPPTVVDAVLARVGKLSPEAQSAVKRLAVVPGGVELGLLRMLQPDLAPVGQAEAAGVLTMRGDVLRFRHELARRTVAEHLPASVRMALHEDVLGALLTDPEPDPFRVLHHAVAAGDDEVVVRYGRLAGRAAARAGAHRQAASCFALVLARGALLTPAQRGGVGEAYAWALSNSNQLQAAADEAATAVEQWRQADDGSRLVRALVTLSRQQWLTEETAQARSSAELALQLAEDRGDTLDQALAQLNLGGVLVLVDQEHEGMQSLRAGIDLAEPLGAEDIVTLATNYLGSARLQLGDLGGRDDLLRSRDRAHQMANHEFVMRAYYNLAEGLWRLGRYDEALGFIAEGEAYGADREFQVYAYMFGARRYRRLAMQGRWAEAVSGLREMLDGQGDPGMIGRETLPVLTRLLVRQGHPDATAYLAESTRHAARSSVLDWLVPTGLAAIEHAWLSRRPELAGPFPDLLLDRMERPGLSVQRGELMRYLKRLGHDVDPAPGSPLGYEAGIRGDWRSAAEAWSREGDPYERALELAGSGEVAPTLEALTTLDRLGARPAAALTRRQLRDLGVQRVPRRPREEVVQNPAGLTVRQVEIVRLLADGLANADIAKRLVLSPRTVDHHVAAVLQKLHVHSRHDAAAEARRLGLAD